MSKKEGPGKGPTNLSGARGASPVLRVRIPEKLDAEIAEKEARTGEKVAEAVRDFLARWVRRK